MQYVTSIKDIKFLPALSVFLSSWSFPRFLSTVYLVHHQMNNANNETFSFLNPQVFRRLTYASCECESQPGSGQAAKCQRRSSSSISPSQAKLGREGGQVELPITFPTARLPTTACAWHAGRGTAHHWAGGGRERERAKP